MPFAAGQLAVFQGGPSRSGCNDEHIGIHTDGGVRKFVAELEKYEQQAQK
jgi:acyl CoA:acetate/3-ketoacid CoA transferase